MTRPSLVISFSFTEAPLPDPAPTPPNTPEWTRNGPETHPKPSQTEPNGAETEPNGAEMGRNQALSGGTAGGGLLGWRGGGGCKVGSAQKAPSERAPSEFT